MRNELGRAIFAIAGLCAALAAHAHPGHDAPVVHAHDLDELILIVAVVLLVVVAGAGVFAVRRIKRKDQP
jgi:uncharacterized membrane protein YphA (DoxX/SURF4 family)